jgi:hypothetical protein
MKITNAARAAAYAARYGEPTDTYTWDLVADKVIEAIEATEITGTPQQAVAVNDLIPRSCPTCQDIGTNDSCIDPWHNPPTMCPACMSMVPVTNNGTLIKHDTGTSMSDVCPGSGWTIKGSHE